MGNLSFDVTRDELIEAFSAAGKVVDAKVPTDRETGRPRGFAFVEFENDEAAQKSISLMNGRDLKGRPLRVNEAENRPPRAPGSAPPFRPRPGGPPPFRSGPGSFRGGAPPRASPRRPVPTSRAEAKDAAAASAAEAASRDRPGGGAGETRRPPGRPRNPRRRRDDVKDDDNDY